MDRRKLLRLLGLMPIGFTLPAPTPKSTYVIPYGKMISSGFFPSQINDNARRIMAAMRMEDA